MKIILNVLLLILGTRERIHAQPASAGEIVINEILFNPPKGGYDYVEGYNKSDREIDLAELRIAKRNSTGDISSDKPITKDPALLLPGAYFVVTANEKWLRQHYAIPSAAVVCQLSSMPSLPDDGGSVIFLNQYDSIIDELAYSARWHAPLIADPSGVALERIDHNLPTQDPNNWTSASAPSGYGTPGNKNSQYQNASRNIDVISVPPMFSPDNDGMNDVELITFNMKEPGFMANTVIYDLSGRKVRYLVKNEPVGSTAVYQWNGLDERAQPLPQGIYLIVTEMFNLAGKTKKFRNMVTLARRG